ncbi:hypothetical protein TNCV_1334901 [Trichonephila clavipes]|nr:hypothetical protein TNCV_1334901 [Trichonephila clavipes]
MRKVFVLEMEKCIPTIPTPKSSTIREPTSIFSPAHLQNYCCHPYGGVGLVNGIDRRSAANERRWLFTLRYVRK